MAAVAARHPRVPQLACSAPSFHPTVPAVARGFALPASIEALGVRRYGFHGLSYEWAASELRLRGKAVIAHLGNGSSTWPPRAGDVRGTTPGMPPPGGGLTGARSRSAGPARCGSFPARMSGAG